MTRGQGRRPGPVAASARVGGVLDRPAEQRRGVLEAAVDDLRGRRRQQGAEREREGEGEGPPGPDVHVRVQIGKGICPRMTRGGAKRTTTAKIPRPALTSG